MAIDLGTKCPAFGCKEKPTKRLFCLAHWRALPEVLRGPTSVRQAVIHLAKKDGYLVEATNAAPRIREDGKGREWV